MDSYFQHRNVVGVALAAAAVITVAARAALTFRENAELSTNMQLLASTDALTGLGNRRKLMSDLERLFIQADGTQRLFAIYDLNGFKRYNDTFGHPTGDALLARLAGKLKLAVGEAGSCYRLGGDEFCTVAQVPTDGIERFLDLTTGALSESGEAFEISSAFGCTILPDEARSPGEVLHVADKRLYAQKYQFLISRGQPHAVLLQALQEREPALREHVGGVADLSLRLGASLGLAEPAIEELGLAAQLHDVGKLAIPDVVLVEDRSRSTSTSWLSSVATRSSARGSSTPHRRSTRWGRSSGPRTSAGTAAATRTAPPAPTSRYRRGSSPCATPTAQ